LRFMSYNYTSFVTISSGSTQNAATIARKTVTPAGREW
jgi:hypothetical protein